MKEDLIEALTSLVFKGKMSRLILAFARASTRDIEEVYKKKLEEGYSYELTTEEFRKELEDKFYCMMEDFYEFIKFDLEES